MANNATALEIPQSRYTKEYILFEKDKNEPAIAISAPEAGEYNLFVFPRAIGTISIDISPFDRLFQPQGPVREKVDTVATSTFQYIINYSPEPGTKVKVRRVN